MVIEVSELEDLVDEAVEEAKPHYYSKKGVRIPPQWWAQLYHDTLYRSLEYVIIKPEDNEIEEELSVHTFWNGVDDRDNKSEGDPLIFETRVEGDDNFWIWPSPNLEIAGVVHAKIVSQLCGGVAPADIEINNPFN